MPEKKEEEEDPKKQKLREHREFIQKVKERKEKLQEDLKSKNINLEEDNVVNNENSSQEESENKITPEKGWGSVLIETNLITILNAPVVSVVEAWKWEK